MFWVGSWVRWLVIEGRSSLVVPCMLMACVVCLFGFGLQWRLVVARGEDFDWLVG